MRDQTCPAVRRPWSHLLWPAGAVGKNTKLARYGLLSLSIILGAIFWWPSRMSDQSDTGSADTIPVLMADTYIPAYTLIRRKMIAVRNFPRRYAPPGSLHAVTELVNDSNQDLYMSAVPIPEGQPLTRTLLEEVGKSHGMSSTLPVGKVAVSFSADPVRGVGGWVEPGDTIAIFETSRTVGPKDSPQKTQLLFSSLPVLAVDRNRLGLPPPDVVKGDSLENPEIKPVVITVLANPPEAARLVGAREQNHLSVVLRSLGDDAPWTEL